MCCYSGSGGDVGMRCSKSQELFPQCFHNRILIVECGVVLAVVIIII